ncbi:polyketide cyclase [Paenibacillus pectinilyticus]|uniref:Polyketide cyclase n=1 Tax=Paenibacillus pectinilyticus TaxID=512399 RepID=A0A1C0ZZ75_9BACL|nr:SRPBCC family protein [Paenibacillus pectinilyticus]OCT13410.1 polyketide cyclase [Paenibacillus pectinilyticus]
MGNLTQEPIVKVEMMIRKPVQEVFEAFINPEITTKFWFTQGSGRLEAGKRVKWEWQMYGASAEVDVKEIEVNKRILIHYGTLVEWTFDSYDENETFVTITNTGFSGTADEMVKQALDSTEGFTIVLCGCKAYLETGVQLNLVLDKAPYAHIKA